MALLNLSRLSQKQVPVLTVLSRHLVRHGAAEERDARELAGAQQVLGCIQDEVTVDARRPRRVRVTGALTSDDSDTQLRYVFIRLHSVRLENRD